MSNGLRIDRKTYARLCELLDTPEYMGEETPYDYMQQPVTSGDWYVDVRHWVEWRTQEEKTKWLKILKQ